MTLDPQVLGLLGTAISAAVAALGYRGKLRHERKRTTRVVLYYLLEMHHRASKLQRLVRDLPVHGPMIIKETLERQGHAVSSEDILKARVALMPRFREFAGSQFDELRQEVLEPYRKALAELAKDDPVLAFELKGQELLNLPAQQITDVLNKAITGDPSAPPLLPLVIEREIADFSRASILRDLERSVTRVAWKCGVSTLLTARRRIATEQSKLESPELKTQMAALVLRMMEIGRQLNQIPPIARPTRPEA